MFLYMCVVKMSVFMYSDTFMKFLFDYQKDDFTPEKSVKEIDFKNNGGKLVKVTVDVND